jgi:hypothetical protein
VIECQLQKLAEYLKVMQSGEAASSDAIDDVQGAVKNAGEAMKDNFNVWSLNLKQICESMCNEFQLSGLRSVGAVEKAFKVMAAMLGTVIREAREYVSQERDAAVELDILARNHAKTEVCLLLVPCISQSQHSQPRSTIFVNRMHDWRSCYMLKRSSQSERVTSCSNKSLVSWVNTLKHETRVSGTASQTYIKICRQVK